MGLAPRGQSAGRAAATRAGSSAGRLPQHPRKRKQQIEKLLIRLRSRASSSGQKATIRRSPSEN